MDKTKITWTHTKDKDGNTHPGSTLNWWIGCTKVSAGCKFCYAERDNKRFAWTDGWGAGSPRKLVGENTRNRVFKWAEQARKEQVLHRVFVSSLSDVFDPEVDQSWRESLWTALDKAWIESEGFIEFLLLTKRIEYARDMLPIEWLVDPVSNEHIRLGVTAEDQENADKRIPILVDVWKGGKNFISAEPLLGFISFSKWKNDLDWIITGGESGQNARPMDTSWPVMIQLQCKTYNIPFFHKQMGSYWAKINNSISKHGVDISEWPTSLKEQEIP